jgi:rhodanese-related sulfurtransferase
LYPVLSYLALSGALAGCGSAPAATIQRLTARQVKAGLDSGELQVVDARSDAAYRQLHIKGAIPLSRVNATTVPKEGMVVTYCS